MRRFGRRRLYLLLLGGRGSGEGSGIYYLGRAWILGLDIYIKVCLTQSFLVELCENIEIRIYLLRWFELLVGLVVGCILYGNHITIQSFFKRIIPVI